MERERGIKKGSEEQGRKVNVIVSGFIQCELRALKLYLVLHKKEV